MSKRPHESQELAIVPDEKKSRLESGPLTIHGNKNNLTKKHSLSASIIQLSGHEGEIYTCKFHPNGETFASAGMDRSIYLWKASGNCQNYQCVNIHSNAILDLQYTPDGKKIVSCSADKYVKLFDLETKWYSKITTHLGVVNSVAVSRNTSSWLVASVSDDCRVIIHDPREKKKVASNRANCPLTAVTFDQNSEYVAIGSVDNTVSIWDLRKNSNLFCFAGHTDTITDLSLSPDGNHLLSNSMDNSIKCWNMRTPSMNKLEKTFYGHQHNFEKNLLRCTWNSEGNLIASGSGDKNIYIWSYLSGELVYSIPGHKGCINQVVFSPKEPLVLSCSSDKLMYLGEIDSSLV